MRALYLGGFEMPDGNAAAQRVLAVGKLLRECRYDVRFCGLAHDTRLVNTGLADGFEFKNQSYPKSLIKTISYLTGNNGAIKEILEYNPDIVILYNYPALAIEKIIRYCRKRKIKVLADVTEWYDPTGSFIYRTIKRADNTRRMKCSHKKLDGLICISDFLADYYKSANIPVLNIPPLVDKTQHKWHQKCDCAETSIKLVYAGTGGLTKDRLDMIMRAVDKVALTVNTDFQMSIIGLTHERYMEIWGDDKEHPNVQFLGRLPHEEVIRQLLHSDFQIFIREDTIRNRAGFPTKFVETISSNTIPITNLSSSLSSYLADGKNGWVIASTDEVSITKALLNAMRMSRDDIEKMKANIVEDTFDYHNYTTKFKQFLEQIHVTR